MRKICFFLIVLLVTFNVYADSDTDQLTVQLKVIEENDFEWFKGDNAPSSATWKENRAEIETLSAGSTLKVYPAVMTNKATPISLKITGGPLTNRSTTEVIKLQATPSGNGATSTEPVVWTGADTDASIVFTEPDRASYEKRVYYGVLELSLTDEGYGNAPALSEIYSATLTLTVDTQP